VLRTRRRLLQAAMIWPVCHALRAARKEFWESKEAAAWTAEERQTLLGQSPWARQGIAQFEAARKSTAGSYDNRGVNVPGSRPGNLPGSASSVAIGAPVPPPPTTDTGQSIQFRVLARWESAKPVRLAGGPELPEGTAGFYVIRLRGMPLLPPRKAKDGENVPNPNEGMLEAIKQGTRIERNGRAAIGCSHLLTGSGDAATELLLFFARGDDPITVAEKIVVLDSRFPPFHLAIKFPLKEMLFQGGLAL